MKAKTEYNIYKLVEEFGAKKGDPKTTDFWDGPLETLAAAKERLHDHYGKDFVIGKVVTTFIKRTKKPYG